MNTIIIENMVQLDHYNFVCWTQAGFKKACKIVNEQDEREDSIEGYPRVYPCVVMFTQGYRGYHYLSVSCTPLNKAIENARNYHQRLVELDVEHRNKIGDLV